MSTTRTISTRLDTKLVDRLEREAQARNDQQIESGLADSGGAPCPTTRPAGPRVGRQRKRGYETSRRKFRRGVSRREADRQMSTIASGKSAHETAVNLAEGQRQAAVVPGVTAATVRAAEITFYKSMLASALSNN